MTLLKTTLLSAFTIALVGSSLLQQSPESDPATASIDDRTATEIYNAYFGSDGAGQTPPEPVEVRRSPFLAQMSIEMADPEADRRRLLAKARLTNQRRSQAQAAQARRSRSEPAKRDATNPPPKPRAARRNLFRSRSIFERSRRTMTSTTGNRSKEAVRQSLRRSSAIAQRADKVRPHLPGAHRRRPMQRTRFSKQVTGRTSTDLRDGRRSALGAHTVNRKR